LINIVCEEEKELGDTQATNRTDFVDKNLETSLYSKDWNKVCFYDEFHLGIGPQVTKRVKRRVGKVSREAQLNVYLKKVTSKDIKAKAGKKRLFHFLTSFVLFEGIIEGLYYTKSYGIRLERCLQRSTLIRSFRR
jgi:hypothetical protein